LPVLSGRKSKKNPPPSGIERSSHSRRMFGRVVLTVQAGTFAMVAAAALIVAAVSAGPHFFPYQTYYVLTGSMEPAMPVGTLIVSTPARASELHVGDVITFQRPDGGNVPVTHRISAVETTPEGIRYATKGDANPLPDPWRVPAEAEPAVVRFAVPQLGNLVRLLQFPVVRLLVIAVPTLLVGSLMLIELTQIRRRKKPLPDDAGLVTQAG
jgi:signal peptidase